MSSLSIRRLSRKDADAAFALALLDDPSLTAEAWRGLVETAPAGGGVLGAFVGDTVRGILRYTLLGNDTRDRLFDIEGLTAFDLFDPAPVAGALVRYAENCARKDHACARIGLSAGFGAANRDLVLRSITDAATLHRVF